MKLFDAAGDWLRTFLNESWTWITCLSYQEWFVLLGCTAALGFMCMRGFGSRSKY